ncbi:SDR family NAD(P)-dependent oxidoreductase [Streptomyces sp. NPDC048297]|uniref:SDR family NAD(P)-dependent oxidoreductase n=1 Tax=Streptomyces sp. NPDC048297 TaxID=3365531 RepID=UPI00371F2BDD
MSGSKSAWDVHNLPDNSERTFLVTGGNAGIGYFISEQLAATGARVLIASRSADKARLAIEAIHSRLPQARVDHVPLDLSVSGSVAGIADRLGALSGIDAVVLNAGVLAQPQYSITEDGNELVFGTNHLGNFALMERLLPLLVASPGSRVVTMGSVAARFTKLDLTDLQSSREPYRPMRTYARSKLAQTVFALELDRRLRAADSHIRSVIAHPGGALDGLTPSRPPLRTRGRAEHLKALPKAVMAQSKENAAWPAVRAALDPRIDGGELWGPRVLRGFGKPVREKVPAEWLDRDVAAELWQQSQRLTGAAWKELDQAAI